MKKTGLYYGGREVLADKSVYYYVLSCHNSLVTAKRALANPEFYYKTTVIITKQGNRYCVVERLNEEAQRKVRGKLGK